MAIPAAFRFIQRLRDEPELRGSVESVGPNPTLDDLVLAAARVGLVFSADDLRAAFRHDWGMRWARYTTRHE